MENGKNRVARERIEDMLKDADEGGTLQGAEEIVAVAILYEGGLADPPSKEYIATNLVQQYTKPGWIPINLMVGRDTAVVMRKLIYGEEIMEGVVLETSAWRTGLATMLANEVSDLAGCSAISFCGDSAAMGQVYFAVLAKQKGRRESPRETRNVPLYSKLDAVAMAMIFEGHLPSGHELDERALAEEIFANNQQLGEVRLSPHTVISARRTSGQQDIQSNELPAALNNCLGSVRRKIATAGGVPGPMNVTDIQFKTWSSVASTVWVSLVILQ